MQPADGGIPALLLEPGHGAAVGPNPVPVGYVPSRRCCPGGVCAGQGRERRGLSRTEAEDCPPVA